MKAKEQAPTAPTEAEKEKSVPENMETTLPTPPAAEQPLDPKEEARRRSKEDLQRKRSRLHNKRGNF
jgi:hypothetical protein